MEILEVGIFWGVSTFEKELHHLQFATFKSRSFVSFKKASNSMFASQSIPTNYVT